MDRKTGGRTHPSSTPPVGVATIAGIQAREGKVYCCVVLDTYSRRVVGWSIDASPTAALVTNALGMAIDSRLGQRQDPGTIIHSDQGVQFGLTCPEKLVHVIWENSRSTRSWGRASTGPASVVVATLIHPSHWPPSTTSTAGLQCTPRRRPVSASEVPSAAARGCSARPSR